MATNTTNYGFKKPDESDFYDVADQNKNWDLADEALKNLDTPTFEDYTGSTAVPSATDAIDQIKSKGKLGTLLANIKAAFKGACLIGHIVNSCVSDRADLPLSAAQGKALMDKYTQLYSEVKMNYWSLREATDILANADLNSYVTPGNYRCSSNAAIPTLKNCPVNNAFLMKVSYPISGSSYILQEFIDLAGRQAFRIYNDYGKTWTEKLILVKNDTPTRYDSVIIAAAKSCRLIFSDSSAFAALVLIQGTTGDGFGAFLVNGYGNEGGPSRYRVSSLNTSGSESRISYAIGTAGEKSITFTNDSTGPVRLMVEEFFNETKISFQIV